MVSKFLNLSIDNTLGGNSPSDEKAVSEKAIKTYVDNNKGDTLPSQSGQSGKFLTTDGSSASWASVDALPSQTGQSGKFLTTNGTSASWTSISAGGYYPDIFDVKWSDHLVDDIQWLRADTFSWQDGTVYETAYNTLVTEYATGTTETVDGITYKRTTNGYKIADSTQETAISNKYSSTGIAWYYILDTTNEKFKLPRTKYGFEGVRTYAGDDIAESLPNITGSLGKLSAISSPALVLTPSKPYFVLGSLNCWFAVSRI